MTSKPPFSAALNGPLRYHHPRPDGARVPIKEAVIVNAVGRAAERMLTGLVCAWSTDE
jgi:hypothetical protein